MDNDSANGDDKVLRPKFGNRHLDTESDVYQHNAWDNVEWDEAFRNDVVLKIDTNASARVEPDIATELDSNAPLYWNLFYEKHENKFFKDRHWLFTEFPELLPSKEADAIHPGTPKRILELGCGVGNTVFPLLEVDQTELLFVYCCDFSPKAVDILKQNPMYNEKRCHAFVFDLTSESWNMPFEPGSLDIVTMIFVLSAIDPLHHKQIISKIRPFLKPSGTILFRDYGYCDLTQARFKSGRCIKDNFYVRGDGTRSYFFKDSEVDNLFSESGFSKVDLHVDRRLLVNRATKKQMYRIWIQAKYTNICQ